MNKSIKTFIKTSGVFFAGNALSKAIIILLLPLYTNYISTESFGYYDLSIAYITIFASVLYFDIWSTVLRFMYDTNEVQQKKQIVTTCWTIFILSSIVFIILGSALCSLYSIKYSIFIIGYGLSVNLHNMSGFVARGWKKNIQFAISGIINTLLMVAGNLIMILVLHMEIESLYFASILGNIAQVIYLSYKCDVLPTIKFFNFNKKLFITIFTYTLPLCINSVAYWLLTSYNRLVIQSEIGLSANGIYAIGNKFGAAIALVTTCFTYAWQDLSFTHESNNNKNSQFYSNACGYYFVFLAIGFSLIIPCFSIAFPYLIGNSYSEAYQTIPIFLIMAILSAFSTFVGNIFYAIKDTKSIFISMVISCICNLLLCRIMITYLGINGANLSICISFLLNIIIRYIILQKKIGVKIKVWHYALPSCLMSIAVCLYNLQDVVINTIYIMVLIILFIVLFFTYRNNKFRNIDSLIGLKEGKNAK